MNLSPSNPDISARELQQRLQLPEQLRILDVREPIEYHTHNIGGLNIPLNKLAESGVKLPWNIDEEIIVICKAGLRSETAQSILQQNGYENVRNLTGGLLALRRIQE
ncbi:rhodanese-like domain-containing protein [Mucilaginibacter sp. Bleaf8]|uniref:rhodanese-like domain-containing protein n=1 Tax=Mucilaginibacter sp. Bleaf8 TaxID=2834430 RepID=UPI001BCF9054|nr:rhodanese-like domain-containing protein [Mucilaginibacter sp. Bleaf8]MBS7563190.1 rhodanese-like domain-containing protein [Mucilaginibacter sp. Bleaf8]